MLEGGRDGRGAVFQPEFRPQDSVGRTVGTLVLHHPMMANVGQWQCARADKAHCEKAPQNDLPFSAAAGGVHVGFLPARQNAAPSGIDMLLHFGFVIPLPVRAPGVPFTSACDLVVIQFDAESAAFGNANASIDNRDAPTYDDLILHLVATVSVKITDPRK